MAEEKKQSRRRSTKTVRVMVTPETYNRIGELTKALGGTRPGNVIQVMLGIGLKYLEESINIQRPPVDVDVAGLVAETVE